jgi:beta-glucosidase
MTTPSQPRERGPLPISAEPFPMFPLDFLWGTATAAFQIEGSLDIDGRGPSIWDTFCKTPGKILTGENADIADDHYARWESDLDLMAELGVNAYRFSISWSRVLPTGRGSIEPRGLAFYDRLVDGLLERGIAPCVTLYHWDLPQALEDEGGWLVRSTSEAFAEYAGIVGNRLGDRIATWFTLNEPVVSTLFGYALGGHAPGKFLLDGAYPAAHHLLLGHGLAVRALRGAGINAPIGLVNNHAPIWPANPDSEADIAAAAALDAIYNRQYLDPVLLGRDPGDLATMYPNADLSCVRPGDLEIMSTPIDVLGVNYYAPQQAKAPSAGNPLPFELDVVTGYPTTSFGWPVVPEAFTALLVDLNTRYADVLPPVLITENGTSQDDVVSADGQVHDEFRIGYLDSHIRAVAAAMDASVDVRGYFAWSLFDNFEWAEGYSQRFGLTYIDYQTQQRIPKDSFAWYRAMLNRE